MRNDQTKNRIVKKGTSVALYLCWMSKFWRKQINRNNLHKKIKYELLSCAILWYAVEQNLILCAPSDNIVKLTSQYLIYYRNKTAWILCPSVNKSDWFEKERREPVFVFLRLLKHLLESAEVYAATNMYFRWLFMICTAWPDNPRKCTVTYCY